MIEQEELWGATKNKYASLFSFVQNMRVRQKRNLFFILRSTDNMSPDVFLPLYGMHCGEFACFQILSEHCRKENKK